VKECILSAFDVNEDDLAICTKFDKE